MRKLFYLACSIFVMISLTGCEKSTVVSQATADAFIKSIKDPNNPGQPIYTVIHSVFSYNPISSVSVASPGGQTIQLRDYDKLGNSFYNMPTLSSYSQIVPALGTYTYTVTFKDNEVLTYTNSISSNILPPPTILGLNAVPVASATKDSVYISWAAISNAQAYQIKILNTTSDTTQVKYIAPFTDASNPKKDILRYGFPVSVLPLTSSKQTFTFVLDALLFETTDYINLQALGESYMNIIL